MKKTGKVDLRSIEGKGIIIGQTIPSIPTADEINTISSMTGKTPGILQFSYNRVAYNDTAAREVIRDMAISHHNNHGLVMVYWQPDNPATTTYSPRDLNITFSDLFIDSPARTTLMKRLSSMADGIEELQDNGITVYFRPYAEFNWAGFWFGNQSDFTMLWDMTYDYMVNTRHLTNIVWVWGLTSGWGVDTNYARYYPGDDKVDVIAMDTYEFGTYWPFNTLVPNYNTLLSYHKPFGFAEISPYRSDGNDPNYPNYNIYQHLDAMKTYYPKAAFYIAFNSYWSLDHTTNLNQFMNDPYAITLDEMYTSEPSRQIEIAVLPNWEADETVQSFEAELGVKLDRTLQYPSINDMDHWRIWLDAFLYNYSVNKTPVLALEFFKYAPNGTKLPTLADIKNGVYDQNLTELANIIIAYNKTIFVRPLPEFNGGWNNWGIYMAGNNREDFIPAFRHVVDVLRNNNAVIKVQLNYNKKGRTENISLLSLYPGDYYVDEVVFDGYNGIGQYTTNWTTFHDSFAPSIIDLSSINKPFGIGETSTASGGGNKTKWISDAFTQILCDPLFSNFNSMNWFFHQQPNATSPNDLDLNTPEQHKTFTDGVNLIRRYNAGDCTVCGTCPPPASGGGGGSGIYYPPAPVVHNTNTSTPLIVEEEKVVEDNSGIIILALILIFLMMRKK